MGDPKMDLIDKLTELSAQIPRQREHIATEEATKTAFVMPFINALGYNVFDPTEVVPEYTADVGLKKGEKVDYAIMREGAPILLFEVKCCGVDLNEIHASQLYRYFSVTAARFGILTDGIEYRFYSDLDAPNRMDDKPFFVFNMLDFDPTQVDELKRFTKAAFNMDTILTTASDLKYTREIKMLLAAEFNSPSEDFVRLFTGQVYSRPKTAAVIEEFTEITKRAFRQFINDRIEQRLKTALDKETTGPEMQPVTSDETGEAISADEGIVTTQEEIDGYLVVKAILREMIDVKRVYMRDVRSYCNILLDDTRLKPICRLHFNTAQKYLGLIDENKQEERVPIDDVDAIYQYADRIKEAVHRYDAPSE
jgi:hypothetical protein